MENQKSNIKGLNGGKFSPTFFLPYGEGVYKFGILFIMNL